MRFSKIVPALAALAILIIPAPSVFAQGMTFEEVCALPTTVNCWGFEDDSQIFYGYADQICRDDPYLANHPNGNNNEPGVNANAKHYVAGNECIYPKRTSQVSASGGWSMKCRFPGQINNPCSFFPLFKTIDTDGTKSGLRFANYGVGGEFWVRFSMRQDDTMLQFSQKRFILSGRATAANLEETIVASGDPGRLVALMYSNIGQENYADGFGNDCYKKWNQNRDLVAPCRLMVANKWEIYELHIKVADNPSQDNGLVELYIDGEAEPVMRITDSDMKAGQQEPYREDLTWNQLISRDMRGYHKLNFTLYSNHQNDNAVHPEGAMWIDDVVISTVRAAPINGSGVSDFSPPAAPSNLQSQ